MDRDIKNKIIVVTGGAQGIGLAIADSFLQNGAKKAILLDIKVATGLEAVNTLIQKYGNDKAVFIQCDVTKDLEEVSSEILKKYKVDILVNNAGIVDQTSARRTIEVNTIATVEWGMKFWGYMRKDKGGRGGTMLNISSIYGFVFDPWAIYYKTSKHAVMGFTKTLGHPYNYEKTGVRVIAICPGFTETTFIKDLKLLDLHEKDFPVYVSNSKIQKVESVGKAAVDVFVTADSSTAWVVKDDEPIKPVPMY